MTKFKVTARNLNTNDVVTKTYTVKSIEEAEEKFFVKHNRKEWVILSTFIVISKDIQKRRKEMRRMIE